MLTGVIEFVVVDREGAPEQGCLKHFLFFSLSPSVCFFLPLYVLCRVQHFFLTLLSICRAKLKLGLWSEALSSCTSSLATLPSAACLHFIYLQNMSRSSCNSL